MPTFDDDDPEAMLEALKRDKKPKKPKIRTKDLLSSGSTLLNLALTNSVKGAFVKGRYYHLVGDSDTGKAQPLDAKVMTPTGWKFMGDLAVGDEVCDPLGGVANVQAIYPKGMLPIYGVQVADGSYTECCAEHLWHVQTNNDRRRNTHRVVDTLTMKSILHQRIYLPEHAPVAFYDRELPIHPYLLGTLIANGCTRSHGSVSVTTADSFVIDKITKLVPEGCFVTSIDDKYSYGIRSGKGRPNPLTEALRALKLYGKLSVKKFIPKLYRTCSYQQRLELLQGLMDGDGYAPKTKERPTYSTSSPRLAKHVAELVRSLGGTAWANRVKKAPKYIYRGEDRVGKPSYEIGIGLPKCDDCFTLPRKKGLVPEREMRPRLIKSIEPVGMKECQCIRVSSKKHLYLTDDFIPTHNTFMTMATFAEAAMNPEFADYRLIHDNAENGALMDVRRYFGKALHERLIPPRGTREAPEYSRTVEEFYFNLDDCFSHKQPCIYILDSMDALSADADDKKFKKQKAVSRKTTDKEEAGTYGMAKAKNNSTGMRIAFNKLAKSGSILIVISQAKVDMRMGMPPGSKTFSGGTSLKFYCRGQIWTSKVRNEVKKLGKSNEQMGLVAAVAVKKNHQTGRNVKIKLPIYHQTGIDDTGSCVDYLIEKGHWPKTKGVVDAKEFGWSLKREELIQRIENEDEEARLRSVTASVWEEIRQSLTLKRKNRYTQNDD